MSGQVPAYGCRAMQVRDGIMYVVLNQLTDLQRISVMLQKPVVKFKQFCYVFDGHVCYQVEG
jgi:hypothetical protein